MVRFNKRSYLRFIVQETAVPLCIWELVLDLVDSILAYFNAPGNATIQKRV